MTTKEIAELRDSIVKNREQASLYEQKISTLVEQLFETHGITADKLEQEIESIELRIAKIQKQIQKIKKELEGI